MAGILRIIRYAILLLFAFAVGATAVFTLTGQGRENLAGLASRLASTPARTISISGLDGIWSGPLTLGTVVVGDEDGPWLKASGVEIDLSYLSIALSNTVKADRLKVGRLEVARLPKPSATAENTGEFALPVDIELGDIDLPDIALGGDLAGEVATLSAKGKLFATSSPLRIETNAAVARTDGKQGNLDLAVLFAPDDNTLDVTVNGSEPQGGVLANFLKFPGAPPVAVSVTGSGPASDWRGEGSFSVDGLVVTRLSGRHQFVDAGSRVEAKGDGDFARFLPAGLRAAAEGRTVIDFAGTLGAGGTVDIEAARLESNTVVATAKGRVDPAAASDFAL
ncbi:MAG: translocation/assembly module TamB, partial [Mesorhizobium sp.]|nr:translocation/assembly module TamB [Mesorhizobium sp.]